MTDPYKVLVIWVTFSVLLALAPVGFNGLRAWLAGSDNWRIEAVGRGELLLLSAALCVGGIGQLLGSVQNIGWVESGLIGIASLMFFVCGMLFADFSAAYRRPRMMGTPAMVRVSLWFYFASFVVSTGCVIVGGWADA